MIKKKYIIILLAISLIVAAFSVSLYFKHRADLSDSIDAEGFDNSNCKDETIMGLIQCANMRNEYAKQQLEKTYQSLMKKATPTQQKALAARQEAWITFITLECEFEAYGYEGQFSILDCLASSTNGRNKELKKLENCDLDDRECPFFN